MARYSIEGTTLTALGDAVRGKVGETREEYVDSGFHKLVNLLYGDSLNYIFPTGTRKVKIKKLSYNTHVATLMMRANREEYIDTTQEYPWREFYRDDVVEIVVDNVEDNDYFMVDNRGMWGNSGEVFNGEFEITSYDADGNVIQVLGEVKNTLTPLQMAEAIDEMPPAVPPEALTITGDCNYKFTYSAWNWFIEKYKDIISTSGITNASNMFDWNKKLERIPFDINMTTNKNLSPDASYLFRYCEGLREVPKITGLVRNTKSFFEECVKLAEVKEESVAGIDWSLVDGLTSSSGGERDSTFKSCECLRKFPMSFLAHGNPQASYSTNIYRNIFSYCYVLDEVVGLPNPHHKAAWTSNAFNSTVTDCYRLKRFTFETQADGTPYTVNWKKQTLNLDTIGYTPSGSYYSKYITDNGDIHGITTAKAVYDDATYQALKNDADWFTSKVEYSRYNKTSAVETINSLPTCPSGAGNTIKFKGAAGSLTDGGAINTMTEEEIAVATAKGWTVSFA